VISGAWLSERTQIGIFNLCEFIMYCEFMTCLKSAVLWDVAPCRSYVKWGFGGTCRLHLQGRRIRERWTSVNRWLPWRCRRYFPPKLQLTQDLHGAAFFILTTVKTSNLTYVLFHSFNDVLSRFICGYICALPSNIVFLCSEHHLQRALCKVNNKATKCRLQISANVFLYLDNVNQ
jgi:hypothetical protein